MGIKQTVYITQIDPRHSTSFDEAVETASVLADVNQCGS